MLTPRRSGSVVASLLLATLALPPAALASIPGSAVPSPASESAKGCVKKREFKQVESGWTAARVARTFGTSGKTVSSALESEIRKYEKCGGDGWVIVNYEKSGSKDTLKVVSRFW